MVLPELVRTRGDEPQRPVLVGGQFQRPGGVQPGDQLQENLPPGWSYEIMGNDISTEMVKRAEAAEYSQVEVNRGLPAAQLVQYFERAGAHWRIAPACAATCRSS